jgi:hypothetical protein
LLRRLQQVHLLLQQLDLGLQQGDLAHRKNVKTKNKAKEGLREAYPASAKMSTRVLGRLGERRWERGCGVVEGKRDPL